jgi:hypothetical protein
MGAMVVLALMPTGSSPPVQATPGGNWQTPAGTPIATYAPGIPTPTNSTLVTSVGTVGFVCQPGIQAGGSAAVVYDSVRLRQSPGYFAKDDAEDTVHYLTKGDVVNVLGGPENQDGLCWWNLEYQGFVGWSADRSSDGIVLLAAGP